MPENKEFNRATVTFLNQEPPFFVKLYWKLNDYHKLELFESMSEELKSSEKTLYIWRNSTLLEIVDQLKLQIEEANNPQAKFRFSSVYKDFKGNFKRKDFGIIRNYSQSRDDQLTVQDLKFHVGDFIDLTIMINNK